MTEPGIACLSERVLLALIEGDGDRAAQAHLRDCALCAGRMRRLTGDIARIVRVLREPPPPPSPERSARWLAAAAGGLALAAGLLAAVVLPPRLHPAAGGPGDTGSGAERAALRRADNELLAAALDEPFPCEWSTEGCADDAVLGGN
jgi:hypothetical protein